MLYGWIAFALSWSIMMTTRFGRSAMSTPLPSGVEVRTSCRPVSHEIVHTVILGLHVNERLWCLLAQLAQGEVLDLLRR